MKKVLSVKSKQGKWSVAILFLGLWAAHGNAEEARLLRFPTVHADRLVFCYAGDLYTVHVEGGIARRLTSDIGYECFPRFSPNGQFIAFTGQYDGNTEVMLIPAEGGVPKRLTYTATLERDQISDRMGPNNIVMTWRDNEHIIYRSRRYSFNDFKGQLFSVSIHGGLSEPLPFSVGGFCSFAPDGKRVAMNRVFREFRTWKYYRGGMADDIWIFDFSTKEWTNITQNDAQDIQPMWYRDRIYYLSDREGVMNLYVYDLNTKATRKVTNYADFDIKFPSLGDGRIAFEKGGYIYIMDCATEQVKQVSIRILDDIPWGRNDFIDASQNIENWDLSPDGNRVVLVARGEVFTLPAESGITRRITHSSGSHQREAVWSPDGRWIAYISDESGEDEIYVVPQDGSGPAQRITVGGDNYKYALRWSPNSKMLLFSDRKQVLQYVDVESKKITVVDQSQVGEFHDYNWSPDSKWICYVQPAWRTYGRIMLYHLDKRTTHPVTDNWYESYEPTFSSDGKYLLLLSDRDFKPTFSDNEFQVAYLNMTRVYIIPLTKKTPSPFEPKNNEVHIESIKESEPSSDKKKKNGASDKKESKQEKPATPPVDIDLDGIAQRLVALPIEPARYSNVQYADGKVYYQHWKSGATSSTLKMYDLNKREEKELGTCDHYLISANGKKMLLKKEKQFYVIDLPSASIQTTKAVDLSNMKIYLNRQQEWRGIFEQCWRQMRDFFYDPNMHGVDWSAMRRKYEPLLPHVNHRADLTYVIGEMIGELNAGHAYVGGGDEPKPKRLQTGLLGAQLTRDASGFYRITKILEGANWSSTLRSPLQDLGVSASVGDYIVAINGIATNTLNDIYEALVNTAEKQVEILLNNVPSTKNARKAIVVPIADESDLYYYNWVQRNIRYVDSLTNGKVGYLHIPNMGTEGLNEFMKYFYPQLHKQALIIDDRGNGGGFVSPLITERIAQRLVYFEMMRNTIGVPDPYTVTGPKVLLVDRYSASDGDIIAYRFRKYQLGKIIGVRTWGGVVGIRGTLPLLDGGYLMRPEFAPYDADQWLIEGYGVDPDIVIDNDPYREYMGKDDQLDKAIEIILDELQTQPLIVPPLPPFPKKIR